jgi:hypothetical protein
MHPGAGITKGEALNYQRPTKGAFEIYPDVYTLIAQTRDVNLLCLCLFILKLLLTWLLFQLQLTFLGNTSWLRNIVGLTRTHVS